MNELAFLFECREGIDFGCHGPQIIAASPRTSGTNRGLDEVFLVRDVVVVENGLDEHAEGFLDPLARLAARFHVSSIKSDAGGKD